jgi:hypothetical protein
MPALIIGNELWPHIFKPKKPNQVGFHSKAQWSSIDEKPNILSEQRPTTGIGCYLIGWRYGALKQEERDNGGRAKGLKWSTMFPDDWNDEKVKLAVGLAVDYWNLYGGNMDTKSDGPRLQSMATKYGIGWVGNAKVDGKVLVIGGMSGQSKVESAFPLMGANANFPKMANDAGQ